MRNKLRDLKTQLRLVGLAMALIMALLFGIGGTRPAAAQTSVSPLCDTTAVMAVLAYGQEQGYYSAHANLQACSVDFVYDEPISAPAMPVTTPVTVTTTVTNSASAAMSITFSIA